MSKNLNQKTWLALLALYLIWGSTYLGIRLVVETIPPFLAGGIRFMISGLILFGWRRLAGDPAPTRGQWKSAWIVGTLLLVGGNGLLSFAEQTIPSGIAALMIGTIPLMMVLLEAIRPGGVKPGWLQILGLVIGFSGIVILIGPMELEGGQSLDWIGLVACLGSAFLWAMGSIYTRSADLPASVLLFTGMEMLAGSAGMLLVSGVTGEWVGFHPQDVAVHSLYGLAYLILIGSLVGFVSYSWLLRNAPISLVSTYAYVNPLVAILLGSWLLDEALNARILISALVIVSSVVLINSSRRAKQNR